MPKKVPRLYDESVANASHAGGITAYFVLLVTSLFKTSARYLTWNVGAGAMHHSDPLLTVGPSLFHIPRLQLRAVLAACQHSPSEADAARAGRLIVVATPRSRTPAFATDD